MGNPLAPSPPPRPILVEILTYAPTQFYHCQHCEFVWQQAGAGAAFHREQLAASIPEDLKNEYADLARSVRDMAECYGGRVVFRLIDAASVEGLWKTVRHNARRYPAFIVAGQALRGGAAFEQVKVQVDRLLAREGVSGAQASPTD